MIHCVCLNRAQQWLTAMCLLFSAASEGRIWNLGLGGKIGTFLDHFGTFVPFGTKSRIRDLIVAPALLLSFDQNESHILFRGKVIIVLRPQYKYNHIFLLHLEMTKKKKVGVFWTLLLTGGMEVHEGMFQSFWSGCIILKETSQFSFSCLLQLFSNWSSAPEWPFSPPPDSEWQSSEVPRVHLPPHT